jgi:hypothetical protein
VGKPLCTVLVWVLFIACFFIHFHVSLLCGRSVCDLVDAVAIGERKRCENSLGDNSEILGICVKYYGRIMWMFCTYLCLVYSISSGWGVSSPGGVNVHYNRLSVCPLYH